MRITVDDLRGIAADGAISTEQVGPIWRALRIRPGTRPRLTLLNVTYYLGALVVMSAMGWFMTEGWEILGGLGIFATSAGYAAIFVILGRNLWRAPDMKMPGGLLITLAVWMTPLAVYGLQVYFNSWSEISSGTFRDFHRFVQPNWVLLELATILTGFLALRRFRFPFLTFPIAFSLWYLSMDLTPLVMGGSGYSWDARRWISLWFGVVILLVSFLADRRGKEDYSYWGYVFGMMAFWGGLSLMDSGSEWGRFLYCMMNVGLIYVAALLKRGVFAIFGSFGVLGYIGYISWRFYLDSMLFPFALSLLGVLLIFVGILFKRYGGPLGERVVALLPEFLRRFQPEGETVA